MWWQVWWPSSDLFGVRLLKIYLELRRTQETKGMLTSTARWKGVLGDKAWGQVARSIAILIFALLFSDFAVDCFFLWPWGYFIRILLVCLFICLGITLLAMTPGSAWESSWNAGD